LRLAKGMCGKSYLMLTGEVAAVQAAIEKARASVGDKGTYLDSSVIAQPDPQICKSIL
ncbi:MAG: BMC domain-containing protein, partial [Ruthenibacterium sp.]